LILARQLAFDLQLRPALGRDDFLVTSSNSAAVALVDQWPNWQSHAAVLVGPPGSGKSHLAEVWRQVSGAERVLGTGISVESVPDLMRKGALVVEDLSPGLFEEHALFHLLNHAREAGGHILFCVQTWPLVGIVLPDLASRFNALTVASILPPDDDLLRGVLVKLFEDRQIVVDEPLISYLMTRMPRSLDMARQLVARIDAAALEQGAEVTRVFAGKVLAELESPDLL
jgi:chromosomal replication initiation ATPase DnaA